MKLPPYPLQSVLELRQRERDAAQEFLAGCLAEVGREERRVAEAEAAERHQQDELRSLQDGFYDPPVEGVLDIRLLDERRNGIRFAQERLAARRREVVARRQRLAEAREQVESARDALSAAAQALTAIEKHRDKWRDEELAELRRKEELLLQEIASAAFVRQREEER
ncbi:MAG TPA: hypothetical protein VMT16_04450 [Thermoanaerobaculia bacterium]|nr:hypothetical protein [Thermoanaerobaculia bacterium]